MNIANKITLSRIFLIPVFMLFLLGPFEWGEMHLFGHELTIKNLVSALIFALLSLTDWVDGYIARKYNLVTNLGKFLDPLADKLLMTAGFVSLVGLQMIPIWMVVAILAREFAVTGLRLLSASNGEVIAAANLGKIKTTAQIFVILLLLIGIQGLFVTILLWFTVLITIYSGYDYFKGSKKLLNLN